eukprot:1144800-Pelagomonas_calceolata.AAC.4
MPRVECFERNETTLQARPAVCIERDCLSGKLARASDSALFAFGMRAVHVQKLDVKLRGVSVILCNDKQSSFGAPDVLQACVDNVALVYKIDSL